MYDTNRCVAEFVLTADHEKCERGTMFRYRKKIYDENQVSEIMDALCDAIEEKLTKNFILVKE